MAKERPAGSPPPAAGLLLQAPNCYTLLPPPPQLLWHLSPRSRSQTIQRCSQSSPLSWLLA